MVTIDSTALALDWTTFANAIPVDLDRVAIETRAIVRRRKVADGDTMLRVLLTAVADDSSYRVVAAAVAEAIGEEFSDEAVRNCLLRSNEFLEVVLDALLREQTGLSTSDLQRPVVYTDGSVTAAPGADSSTERLHATLDGETNEPLGIELTDTGKTGVERLQRFGYPAGSLVVGDRGYGKANDISCVRETMDAHVLTRVALSKIRFAHRNPGSAEDADEYNCEARRFSPNDVVQAVDAMNLAAHEAVEFPVYALPTKWAPLAGRLIAIRKTEAATATAIKKLKRRASKNGHTLRPLTLAQAPYLFLFTTLPDGEISPTAIGQVYRCRWQIEVYFKHLKSDMGYARVRAFNPQARRSLQLAKIIESLLVAAIRRSLPPPIEDLGFASTEMSAT